MDTVKDGESSDDNNDEGGEDMETRMMNEGSDWKPVGIICSPERNKKSIDGIDPSKILYGTILNTASHGENVVVDTSMFGYNLGYDETFQREMLTTLQARVRGPNTKKKEEGKEEVSAQNNNTK